MSLLRSAALWQNAALSLSAKKTMDKKSTPTPKSTCDSTADQCTTSNPGDILLKRIFPWIFKNITPVLLIALLLDIAMLFTIPMELVNSGLDKYPYTCHP